MDKLRNVSEDITDVMQCLEQMGGTQHIKSRKISSLVHTNIRIFAHPIVVRIRFPVTI